MKKLLIILLFICSCSHRQVDPYTDNTVEAIKTKYDHFVIGCMIGIYDFAGLTEVNERLSGYCMDKWDWVLEKESRRAEEIESAMGSDGEKI